MPLNVIAITSVRQGLGEVPSGLVLYHRDHGYEPYVVHCWTDHRSFKDGTALALFRGDYCATLEQALERYRERCSSLGYTDVTDGEFFDVLKYFHELESLNKAAA